MPIASKRRVEAHKAAPVIAAEPEPRPEEIDLPPAIRVTALIFSYDSAPALRRCLSALEGSNDRASIEILVVDCGSHDESAQLDSEFSGITMLRLPRYFGRTKALNIGTRSAAGEYLFFMTPEVEVLPTTIPSLVAQLEASPETVAVCPLLLDTEIQRALQQPTSDLTAYHFYLRSLPLIRAWSPEANLQAIALLERAVECDPRYGMALASLAARVSENAMMLAVF